MEEKEEEEVIITWLEEGTEVTQDEWDELLSGNEGDILIPVIDDTKNK